MITVVPENPIPQAVTFSFESSNNLNNFILDLFLRRTQPLSKKPTIILGYITLFPNGLSF